VRAQGVEAGGDEALRTDAYVDWLLEAVETTRSAASPLAPDADPTVAMAARTLRETLGRAHPSFRFEERLSRRLADLAVAMRRAAAVGESSSGAADPGPAWKAVLAAVRDRRTAGDIVAFPGAPIAVDGAAAGAGRPGVRPVIAGGAVASAALSLGAAAVVAWRRTHVRRGIV
jgi:hypothetical protein